jgi:hypothetical protein
VLRTGGSIVARPFDADTVQMDSRPGETLLQQCTYTVTIC